MTKIAWVAETQSGTACDFGRLISEKFEGVATTPDIGGDSGSLTVLFGSL